MVSKRKVERIILTERQEKILRKYANKRDVSIQDKGRIDIVLLDSEGKSYKAITRILNRKYNTVKKWCIRWQEHSSELLLYGAQLRFGSIIKYLICCNVVHNNVPPF